MDIVRTTKNKALQAAGFVKETAGRIVGNTDLEIRGQADQTTANLRQAAVKAQSALRSVGKAFRG